MRSLHSPPGFRALLEHVSATAHLADLCWIAGEPEAALATWEQAWERGDSEAFASLAILDRPGATVAGLIGALESGRIALAKAWPLAELLVALAAWRDRDPLEARARALELLPAVPVSLPPLPGPNTPPNALSALAEWALASEGLHDGLTLLLDAAMLACEGGIALPLAMRDAPILSSPELGGSSLRSFALLLELAGSVDADAPVTRDAWRDLAAADCEDEGEALAFAWSHEQAAPTRTGAALRRAAEAHALCASPALLQALEARALGLGDAASARRALLARSAATRDRELQLALLLRSLAVARRSRDREAIAGAAEALVALSRRREGVSPAAATLALRTLRFLAIEGEEGGPASSPLVRSNAGPPPELPEELARILTRGLEPGTALTPADAPLLVTRMEASFHPIARRTALQLVLTSGGAASLAAGLRASEPTSAGAQEVAERNRDLAAWATLFGRRRPHRALDELLVTLEESDGATSAERAATLAWGVCEAAAAAGEAGAVASRLRGLAERDGAPALRALWATAAALLEERAGSPTSALEAATLGAALAPDDAVASAVAERLNQRANPPARIGTGTLRAVVGEKTALAGPARLVREAEEALAAGRRYEAADALAVAATAIAETEPIVAAALLVRAAGALRDEPDGATRGEAYLRRAVEVDPQNPHAWVELTALLSRRGAHDEVADLAAAPPRDLRDAELPRGDLRRSARALAADVSSTGPGEAARPEVRVLTLLLDAGPGREGSSAFLADVDLYLSCETGPAPSRRARDRLARLILSVPTAELRAELNLRLGQLHHAALGDVRRATEHLRLALASGETRARARAALVRVLTEVEEWDALVELHLHLAQQSQGVERTEELEAAAALLAERLDRPAAAAEALEMALRDSPGDPAALRHLAALHLRAEAWELAADALTRLAERTEEAGARSALHQQVGAIHQMHLEQPEQAHAHYLRAFEEDPENSEVFERLLRLHEADGRFEEQVALIDRAIDALRRAEVRDAGALATLYRRRAEVEGTHLDRPQAAAESLLEAVRLNPTDASLLRAFEKDLASRAEPSTVLEAFGLYTQHLPETSPNLPRLLRAQGSLAERIPGLEEQALGYYRRYLSLRADAKILQRVARSLKARSDWDALLAVYEDQLRVVTDGEERASLFHRLARLFERDRRDLTGAARAYERLLQEQPASTVALRSLGRLYEGLREWDRLIEVSRAEVALSSDRRVRAHLFFKIGSILETHRGDDEGAASYYLRAVEADPRCVPALHGMRDIRGRRGDFEGVIEYLERECEVWDNAREKAGVHTRIAEVLWRELGRHRAALSRLATALELVPDYPPALRVELDIHFARGDWSAAEPIALSLSQRPQGLEAVDRGELFFRRGKIAWELGHEREAVESLRIALDIAPTDPRPLAVLTEIAVALGEGEAQDEFFAHLHDVLAERGDAPALARLERSLGILAESHLRLDDAIARFERAVGLDPASEIGLDELLRVLLRTRDFEGALREAEAVAAAHPGTPAARRARLVASRVLADHLDRGPEARAAVDDLLAETPDDPELVFERAQLAYADADWSTAHALAVRLLRLEGERSEGERALHHFFLGRVLDAGFDSRDGALEQYALARSLAPADPRALRASALILARRKEWAALDELVAGAADALEDPVPALQIAAQVAEARGDRAHLAALLERLGERSYGDPVGRELRVSLLSSGNLPAVPSTLDEYRDLLATDPLDLSALDGFAKAFVALGDAEAAACVGRVAALLRGAPTAPTAALPRTSGALTESTLRTEVCLAGIDEASLELLRILGPELGHLGLSGDSRVPTRLEGLSPAHALALDAELERLRWQLPPCEGLVACHLEGPRGCALTVAVTDEPFVIAELPTPRDGAEGPVDGRVCFLLAHACYLLSRGIYVVRAMARADLAAVLTWLGEGHSRGAMPRSGTDWPWLSRANPALFDRLDAALIGATPLVPRDPRHATQLAEGLERESEREADRVGLLLCDDLWGAVDTILALEGDLSLATVSNREQALRRSPRILGLLRWALSAEYLHARTLLLGE
jgi:hypothetical protein